jgi:hypothetical protein
MRDELERRDGRERYDPKFGVWSSGNLEPFPV